MVPDSFSLGSAANAGESTVGAGCNQNYIQVATAQSNAAAKAPRICGDVLNPTNALTTAAPVDGKYNCEQNKLLVCFLMM